MEKISKNGIILILGLLSAIGPFSIDMYLPGFPAIAKSLHATIDQVAYSLSSFFLGVCLGQLICGPLLDRYGRRPVLIVGMVIYILASIGCTLSTSVNMLVAFRFIQALGGCVCMVAPGAVVRDVFPVQESARIFSYLILILSVSPILAPTVGGFLTGNFHWSVVFWVLAGVAALVLFLVYRYLPESGHPDGSISLHPASMMRGYREVLRQKQFVIFAVAGSIAAASLFSYIAGSPFVFMNLYGVSEQHYGWIFSLIAAGLISASQVNNLLLKHRSSAQILRRVIPFQAIVGIALVVGTAMHALGLYSLIALLFLFLSCQGFTFPNASSLAMAPFDKGAGSASALLGAMQMAFGAFCSFLVGLFFNGTALPMVVIMAVCALIASLILLTAKRKGH